MGIVVNTNIQSLNAQRLLGRNTLELSRSFEKLASGYRINRAADDAAGLQISETLRSTIRGSQQALNNVQDGTNVLNIVDGAFDAVTTSLQRVRELAVQGSNDTLSSTQRSAINQEIGQLITDITRISKSTEFNGKKLLDGSQTTFKLQVGAGASSDTNVIDIANVGGITTFGSIGGEGLGLGSAGGSISVISTASALNTISKIDAALGTVNNRRAAIGAITNRLTTTASNISVAIENFSASESRIRNVDVAKESANLTRNQVLQQASSTVLAQANQTTQLALSLLQR
jgi:flagellin